MTSEFVLSLDKLSEPLSTLLYRETTMTEEFLGKPARPLPQILLSNQDCNHKSKILVMTDLKGMIACSMGEIMACKSLTPLRCTPLDPQCPLEGIVEPRSSLRMWRPS